MQVFTALILPMSLRRAAPSRTSMVRRRRTDSVRHSLCRCDIEVLTLPAGEGIPHNLLPTVKIYTNSIAR